jgi:hypothetical protein
MIGRFSFDDSVNFAASFIFSWFWFLFCIDVLEQRKKQFDFFLGFRGVKRFVFSLPLSPSVDASTVIRKPGGRAPREGRAILSIDL